MTFVFFAPFRDDILVILSKETVFSMMQPFPLQKTRTSDCVSLIRKLVTRTPKYTIVRQLTYCYYWPGKLLLKSVELRLRSIRKVF